jgi:hypothetical protein
MDIVNILNEKEAAASSKPSETSQSPNWAGQQQIEPEKQEQVRLPSIAQTGFSTYPHAPYAPRYSFEVQSPAVSIASISHANPALANTAEATQSSQPDDPTKPYHCKTCRKGFARRSDLSRHGKLFTFL